MQLTAPQQRVLTLIHDWLRREGYPPTLRELAQHLGVCIGTIQTHLRALQRKGALERRPFQARGLCPTARAEGSPSATVREVPLRGNVAAGKPLRAEEPVEGVLPLPTAWATGEDLLCLRVCDDSMRPTMREGDDLLVRRQATVEHGAIAVASIEGEVTVKRVVLGGNGLTLQPDNEAFPTLRVHRRLGSVEIIGKAIGVYRKL